ncbi:MAG: hypothetical protein IJX24_04790 [Oscillospiraceae bacterium]|nr:hypothetical protein [Oscillospiraceae bacterium]
MYKSTYAKNFIKEYNISKIDIEILRTIINKLGYKLIEYNLFFNIEHTDKLVIGLELEKELRSKFCFTYKNEHMSYIFVREGIKENELILILLQELGHIYMKHLDNDVTENSSIYEFEADLFAVDVLKLVNRNKKIRYLMPFALGLVVTSLLLFTVIFVSNKSGSVEYQYNNSEIASEATASDENNTNVYYVSHSGSKYHTADCYHIDVAECAALTLEEIQKLGYEPCKTCRPDKIK